MSQSEACEVEVTNEIPNSPRRNGMVCWQIRHERQPDGSLKMRREYGMPDDNPIAPICQPETAECKPVVQRGVVQRNLI